jgi:hypothetical protein
MLEQGYFLLSFPSILACEAGENGGEREKEIALMLEWHYCKLQVSARQQT